MNPDGPDQAAYVAAARPADPRAMAGDPTEPPVVEPRPSAAGPETGHPGVDAALRSLTHATSLPPADQIAEYEEAHRVLSEALAMIDEG